MKSNTDLELLTENTIVDKVDATHSYDLKVTNKRPWFSPAIVIAAYLRLAKKVGHDKLDKDGKFKQVREMKAVALFLLGIIQAEKREYWLQSVVDQRTPDVRTICFDKDKDGVVQQVFQEVELVTHKSFSKESLIEFIKTKKLENTNYPPYFVILCELRKNFSLPSAQDLFQAFNEIKPQQTIALIGRTSPLHELYRTMIVYPRISHIEDFNALELVANYDQYLKSQGRHHTMVLSYKPKVESLNLTDSTVRHHPFEDFLDSSLLV